MRHNKRMTIGQIGVTGGYQFHQRMTHIADFAIDAVDGSLHISIGQVDDKTAMDIRLRPDQVIELMNHICECGPHNLRWGNASYWRGEEE